MIMVSKKHCIITSISSTKTTTGTSTALIVASVVMVTVGMVEGAAGAAELLVAMAAVGMAIIVAPKFTMVTGSVLTLVSVTVCDSAVAAVDRN